MALKAIVVGLLVFSFVEPALSFVRVEYLRKAQRLNATLIDDYYFCCNTEGTVIQWGVNGVSLGGYTSSDIGTTVVSRGNGYNFTTTLLSARSTEENNFLFDSIIMISIHHSQAMEINVSCTNNVGINTTSNNAFPKVNSISNTRKDAEVGFEYVLSAQIVQNTLLQTYIFVCGTNSTTQVLGVPTVRAVGFSSHDQLGDTKNLKNDTIVGFQAILIDRQIYTTTTLAFVTSSSKFSITCSYAAFEQTFNSSMDNLSFPRSSEDQPTNSNVKGTTMALSVFPTEYEAISHAISTRIVEIQVGMVILSIIAYVSLLLNMDTGVF